MVRLFILYAILIFAKKAPKLISDLLNLNKDGESVGLKGLNIKNKMGEAALVGDKVKKGMTRAEGIAKGAAGGLGGGLKAGFGRGFVQGFKNTPGGFKAKLLGGAAKGTKNGLQNGIKGFVTGGKNGYAMAKQNDDTKGVYSNAKKGVAKTARGGKNSMWDTLKNGINAGIEKVEAKGFSSLATARANEVDGYKSSVKGMFGSKHANTINNAIYNPNGNVLKKYLDGIESKYKAEGMNENDAKAKVAQLRNSMFDQNGNFDLTKDSAMDYIKSSYKGVADATNVSSILKLGFDDLKSSELINDADSLSLKQNILKQRDKVLTSVEKYDSQIANAKTMGDEVLAANITAKRDKLLTESISSGLFEVNGGISSRNDIGIPEISNNKDNIRADIDSLIAKNSKMLSATEKDIQSVNAVEKSNGTNKDKNEGK